ncbi:tRNA (adenosine(37)-N6)-threonylcarbamoyltransferase complex dimerization subunit type 1 TsaB [Leuconostoc gasicomitatum]|uniref:tRNA (adenosine(37)-N6)-threonylcarbamoyltransferase complex dimerization subunit type 1 TsaB n=1 Tax=Leuconostoc gasicomitatum TaxID=115778 RepID=UPI001CC3C28C|nr:tRNA (adenosine(37)-N6)-threonylcarbamoyltransferase complex dimerization subunit type 1 TsaB [Leuconostoc gasicomitatum]MBZ5969070.1 tRNA (adenosine(37)-N6)-threonylcarbamoyltransferase complex dimerization subunit type 1 TsaB [Leuconostoc gasicomitatum]MBZ5998447.1 tRNA (adenosine(37)-N6)-threonylcarbamoyltransferase complex dimerization subunit type 1 TsaB [Leuconostoc gasicomitatum]
MKILAFDTSNQPLTVSLAEDNQVKRVFSTNEARNHSIQLLPAIQETIAAQNWTLTDIDRIVVAQGPGSFTGLRIGITVAKVLADTLKIDLVGVSSLAVLAEQVTTQGLIVPLFNARNENVFAGVYREGNNILADAHQPIANLFNWLQTFDEPIIFLGDTDVFSALITETFGARAHMLTPSESLPNGHGIVSLGIQASPVTNIADFNPQYLRKTQAELNWLAAHPGEDNPENYVFEV